MGIAFDDDLTPYHPSPVMVPGTLSPIVLPSPQQLLRMNGSKVSASLRYTRPLVRWLVAMVARSLLRLFRNWSTYN